jgi:hypothetical protein
VYNIHDRVKEGLLRGQIRTISRRAVYGQQHREEGSGRNQSKNNDMGGRYVDKVEKWKTEGDQR